MTLLWWVVLSIALRLGMENSMAAMAMWLLVVIGVAYLTRHAGSGLPVPLLLVILPAGALIGPLRGLLLLGLIPMFGTMYHCMGYTSRQGAHRLPDFRPSIIDDILAPGVQVLEAAVVVGVVTAVVFLGPALLLSDVLSTPAPVIVVTTAVVVAGWILGPMVYIILGGVENSVTALNPLVLGKAVRRAPWDYMALCGFLLVLGVLSRIGLMAFAGVALEPFPRSVVTLFCLIAVPIALAATYYMMVTGWRMGLLVWRNPQAFEHLE